MKFNLKVYCEKTRLKEIRSFVQEKLQNYTTDEIEINQLILAVDEVCANFIIHSNDCNASEVIYLDVDANEKGVTFEISDNGIEFDFSTYKEPTLEQVIKDKRKGGIGLMLVNRIMDKVEFFTMEKNNKCILHKNFNKH
ncbi:MAG: serine/threonine-protein kinase RsbW [Marivirga sp.]|jgi:serine/threonine-protein kinase RsbW